MVFLFLRCLENAFEEERNKNTEGNSREVTVVTVERDWDDETLGLGLGLVA